MKKRALFVLIMALVLSMIAVDNVMAQSGRTVWNFLQSPTSISTRSLYSSYADDFIHTAYYKSVEFDKFYSFASFAYNTRGILGFAKSFGDTYVAAYYGGNLFAGYTQNTFNEINSTTHGSSKTFRNYTSGTSISNTGGNNNRFALLIGVGDMGFRFSYASTRDGLNKKDIQVPIETVSTLAKKYKTANGWIIPQFQWGMTRTLTEQGIQPTVTFDLGFHRLYTKYEPYTGANWRTNGEIVLGSMNFVQPVISLGLGGYSIHSGEAFEAIIDLDYTLTLRMHKNDYSYLDGGQYKTKSIKGFNSRTTVAPYTSTLTENKYNSNYFEPSIKVEYTGNDRLGFAAKLSLPLTLLSERRSIMGLKANYDLQKNGADASIFTFSLSPSISLGAQYDILPGKLALNAGGMIRAVNFSTATTKTDTYTAGSKTGSTLKSKTTTWSATGVGSGLYAGFNFNFNENIGLEANTGVQNSNDVNIFGTGSSSLTYFASILASLKF